MAASHACRRVTLVLLGAPLGNPADACPRLRDVLASADVVAAEDTRRLRRLARDLGVKIDRPGRLLLRGQRGAPYARAGRRLLAGGATVAAGHRRRHAQRVRPRLPAGPRGGRGGRAGDRRARAVRGHHRAGAVRPAVRPVLLRGLPAAQGRASGARALAALPTSARTLVFFEAPHRLAATLADWPPRSAPTGRPRSAGS